MDVTRSLLKLTIGTGCIVGGLAFPPLLAADGIVWGTILATALASVAAGNTANAIDALIDRKDGDRISLQNQDLTKAVGKAIAAVITLAALQNQGKTHDNLEKIASQATNNWVKIAQQELTQQRYPQLREAKLDQFLTPEEYSLTQEGNLTHQEWQDIFIRLNMAACKGGGFQLPPEVYPQVAELLHTTFPKALRETLKEDFANDGKAFAGLTLQLLTGMKAELAQLRNTNLAVNTAELTQILQQFQQLETQLRGTVAQQQAFFRQISQDIDSGFAEVCQQLGVMETNITALLQNLEKRLEALDEKLARLEAPRGRQLSKQEYRNRQALLSQMGTEVESRLAQSLHHAVLLNLGKEQQPHQVQRPWDVSVKVGEQRSFQLPSQTSILEVFENPVINGKFLILGKPGGGKTTTLLELAQALVERAETDSDAPIPVILELSEWRTVRNKEENDHAIKEWILSQLRSKGVSKEIREQWIREKELVLLLDGLDELPSERQAKCVRAINQFLDSEFSPLHLVVCSRKEEYEEYEEVLHLNGAICLEDLSVEQIQHYFASVNLGEFWESIKDSEKIVNFISQPLFLAITSIAYQQIDVEEWKNCNTEEKAIDYLLGIYRVEMLRKTSKSKWYSRKQPLAWKSQNILIRLAQYLDNTQNPQKEFRVNKLQGYILPEEKISIPIRLTFYFSLLILFPTFLLLILIDSPVSILILMGLIMCVSYSINCSKEVWEITFVRIKTFNPFNVLSTFIALFVYALLALLVVLFIFIVSYFPTYLPIYGLDVFPYTLAMLREVGGDLFVWVVSLFAGFSILVGFGYNEDEIINEDDEITSRPDNIFLNTFLASVVFFAVGMLSGFIPSLKFGTIIALGNGTLLGLIFSSLAWWDSIKYLALRLILGLSGYMPWNISRFLNYCTERLILQRVGNRYRFIHRLVQEHFANLEIQKE
jgi:flagellar biosynthesis GTPase FlhF